MTDTKHEAPAGYVMAPVEPTPEMCAAGFCVSNDVVLDKLLRDKAALRKQLDEAYDLLVDIPINNHAWYDRVEAWLEANK